MDCPQCEKPHQLQIVVALSAEDMTALRPNALDYVSMDKVRHMINKNVVVDAGYCDRGHGLVVVKQADNSHT